MPLLTKFRTDGSETGLGFLFPAFNDRNTDLHSMLYYSRNPEELHPEIPEDLFGCPLPIPAKGQKETFSALVEETFGEDCGFEVAKTIHENLNRILEEKKDDPEPASLDKNQVERLLSDCGRSREQLEHFAEEFDREAGKKPASWPPTLPAPGVLRSKPRISPYR